MEYPGIIYSMNDITLALLLGSLIIFGYLAFRSRNIRKFQFQISIFIIVWVIGEIIQNKRIVGIIPSPEIGLVIHASSMVFLTIMLWLRLYFSKKRGKTMIEEDKDI
jgi:hypothetical protein